jgi:hypothetical protein
LVARADETEEVRRLRREIETLREDRGILGKAASSFAEETGRIRERGFCSWGERRRIIRWPALSRAGSLPRRRLRVARTQAIDTR